MILSDLHEFVFIKTGKTAGSSIEVALSQVCGPDDVVTMLSPPEAGHVPRNVGAFRERLAHLPPLDEDSVFAATLGPHVSKWPDETMAHLPASVVADALPDLWARYFTFCVERNPWDRVVSAYHFAVGSTGVERSFAEWLPFGIVWLSGPAHYLDESGALLVDRVLRYDRLDDELFDVGRQVGVDIPPLPRAKGGMRPTRDYREYFDDETAALVAERFAWPIAHFGFEF